MATEHYEIVIDPLSEEDGGGFVATVTELPGCMSDGRTQEEALANVKDAMTAWLTTAAKMGREIPAPHRAFA
ncbi:MAG: type II toxin-antitoxin system HicB family antitoxin [Croceibacterium sp.]